LIVVLNIINHLTMPVYIWLNCIREHIELKHKKMWNWYFLLWYLHTLAFISNSRNWLMTWSQDNVCESSDRSFCGLLIVVCIARIYVKSSHSMILVNSEHKLWQIWNTCVMPCIYWSITHLNMLLIF
jgi:hypothetical protein